MANERRDTRLDTLAEGDQDADVRAVFSWSYRQLTAGAQRVFRLLGLHPGPDISAFAAASLAGVSPVDVRPLLTELTRSHLLAEHQPGRYAPHDLLLEAQHDPIALDPPAERTTVEPLADHNQAMAWFTAQRHVLLACLEHAAATGSDTHTWRLAWALNTFLHRRGHWHERAAA